MALRPPEHPWRVVMIAVGLLVVANLAWFGYRSTDTSTGDENRPNAIDALFPVEGSVVRPQEIVGVDLRDDLIGVLEIQRVRIPEDQYEGDPAVGQVFFRPGEGQEFRELPEGPIEATVDFWDRSKTEEQARDANEIFSYTWRFTVG